MNDFIGAAVVGIGYLMIGIAYIWLALAATTWAIEALRDPDKGHLAVLIVLIVFFPIAILAWPLLARRQRKHDEGESAFPV